MKFLSRLCVFLLLATGASFADPLRPVSEITHPQGFLDWQANFRARALANGISPQIFDRAFAGTGYNSRVVYYDRNQAEFKSTMTEYLGRAILPSRVNRGKAMAQQYANLLAAIERNYGVERAIVLGIWGVETRFGQKLGDIPIAEALGSLAYDGRRRGFAEEQLMAALRLAQRGEAAPEAMVGSWAGALGHTQFIPTSYTAYAVDGNGDGRRNLWEVADALASTANYLRRSGWKTGQPWGVEVRLPSGFAQTIGEGNWQSVNHWNGRGVRLMNGAAIPNYGNAAIIAPAGAAGPKFAIFNNFRVIKRYNNATKYAIAVGHLGDLVTGKPSLQQAMPRTGSGLLPSEVEELQKRLHAAGFPIRKIDGIMGQETRNAIKAYQQRNGLQATGLASQELLNRLRR